jgi:hypothetical protein
MYAANVCRKCIPVTASFYAFVCKLCAATCSVPSSHLRSQSINQSARLPAGLDLPVKGHRLILQRRRLLAPRRCTTTTTSTASRSVRRTRRVGPGVSVSAGVTSTAAAPQSTVQSRGLLRGVCAPGTARVVCMRWGTVRGRCRHARSIPAGSSSRHWADTLRRSHRSCRRAAADCGHWRATRIRGGAAICSGSHDAPRACMSLHAASVQGPTCRWLRWLDGRGWSILSGARN